MEAWALRAGDPESHPGRRAVKGSRWVPVFSSQAERQTWLEGPGLTCSIQDRDAKCAAETLGRARL